MKDIDELLKEYSKVTVFICDIVKEAYDSGYEKGKQDAAIASAGLFPGNVKFPINNTILNTLDESVKIKTGDYVMILGASKRGVVITPTIGDNTNFCIILDDYNMVIPVKKSELIKIGQPYVQDMSTLLKYSCIQPLVISTISKYDRWLESNGCNKKYHEIFTDEIFTNDIKDKILENYNRFHSNI